MGLTLSCPYCANQFDLVAAMENTDGRRFVDLLTQLQPHVIRPLMRYLYLFKPDKQGMRWSRMYTLVKELAPMIKDAQVKHNGMTYVVPPQTWADVITDLCENPPSTLRLPLKSHGYLITILAAGADKAAGKVEREEEDRKRARTPGAKPPGWVKDKIFNNEGNANND